MVAAMGLISSLAARKQEEFILFRFEHAGALLSATLFRPRNAAAECKIEQQRRAMQAQATNMYVLR